MWPIVRWVVLATPLTPAQDKHAIDEKITEFTNNQAQLEPLYGSQDQQECARVSCCHVVNTAICLLQV